MKRDPLLLGSGVITLSDLLTHPKTRQYYLLVRSGNCPPKAQHAKLASQAQRSVPQLPRQQQLLEVARNLLSSKTQIALRRVKVYSSSVLGVSAVLGVFLSLGLPGSSGPTPSRTKFLKSLQSFASPGVSPS